MITNNILTFHATFRVNRKMSLFTETCPNKIALRKNKREAKLRVKILNTKSHNSFALLSLPTHLSLFSNELLIDQFSVTVKCSLKGRIDMFK